MNTLKINDIPDEFKFAVEFACALCIEKRNLTLIGKAKLSPCALRSIRGEVCDEIEKVLDKYIPKNPVCVSCGQHPREESSMVCYDCRRRAEE